MQVSVIIPMYNSEKTIIAVLNSVKNQTAIKDIGEVIIVNDGSNDNSKNLVEEYIAENSKLNIKLLEQENKGVSSARNLGMENSKCELIALLDSDDVWHPLKIEKQLSLFESNQDIDFLGGPVNNHQLRILFKKIDRLYKVKIKDLCLKSFPHTPTVLFKKRIYDEIGGFDENQKYCEDLNYFMKICLEYGFYYSPESMVEIGFGKPPFGHSGLSGNLKKMHEGTIKNIQELKQVSAISKRFYLFLRVFYWFKYIRRIIITRFRHISG